MQKRNASRRWIAGALLPLAACTAQGNDPTATSAPPDPSSRSRAYADRLPRRDTTVADRTRWFERLHWPNGCEDDFVKTRLTDDGGLEFHTLAQGVTLLVVRCALGAYQPTSVVLQLDERASRVKATVLEFPTFESLDGSTLAPARSVELVGEITVLDARNALTVLSLARQIGDCGTWARYELRGGAPVLNAFAQRVACPEEPGAPANPGPGEPPEGWKSGVPN